jgi:hypothetical protein
MTSFRIFATGLLLSIVTGWVLPCHSLEENTELERRNAFLTAYNWRKANERLAALDHMTGIKEPYSIEMLYYVSWMDPDTEVRSRAFSILVRCPDKLGYTAYLAANSFKREKEMGVKVEKAVALSMLRYKWSALNELVDFLRTTRWSDWYWWNRNQSAGYIAAGTPPGEPGYGVRGEDSGDKQWQNREVLRWRNENEFIAHITGVVNRMAGTQIESRPRIDQEIVKWWDRKSELWADYDRKLRAKELGEQKDIEWNKMMKAKGEDIMPGKDVLPHFLSANDAVLKGDKPKKEEKAKAPIVEDEVDIRNKE